MRIHRAYFDENTRLKDESIFSIASGKLGIRGCFEEGAPTDGVTIRGAYINGFCENEAINYNEKLFGFPESKQTIVNLPDAQTIKFTIENEPVTCWSNKAKDFNYVLNMEDGLVSREFIYDTNSGKLKFNFERFISFNYPGLFVIKTVVSSIDYRGVINIDSTLQADVKNFTSADDPRVASGSGRMLKVCKVDVDTNDNLNVFDSVVETINSKRQVKTSVINKISLNGDEIKYDVNKIDYQLIANSTINIKENDQLIIEKYCFYKEIVNNNNYDELMTCFNLGYEKLKSLQVEYMHEFWNNSRVLIDCEDIKQENLDFSLFMMLASAGQDGLSSIAAKGLSGEGYEGHYFWDCETYIYPFFLNTNPYIAKKLLMYRYSKLDEAKAHAKTLGHNKGALYPWRTITGSECSSYFPSGSAQYHINGDIANAFIQYWNTNLDYDFLPQICEVLLETSRLWMDVGHYDNDLFKIDCVTGPDEYTCMVNNNYYTNAGAVNNLRNAYRLIHILKNTKDYETFKNKTQVSDEELDSFLEASEKMYYPFDSELNIIKQDDSFLNKKKLDLDTIPKENYPLLLHYHPLFLYRHQICKQADAVLADYLFTNLKPSISMATFDYYEKVTTHDSSLSKCIFGIVASKLGDLNKAKEYFIETLDTDINDCKGNTKDGLHIANMGGCYRMVSDGFAGLRINDDGISLFPMLPEGINSYSFNIMYRGKKISIYVDRLGCKLKTDSSEPLGIKVYDELITINNQEVLVNRKIKGYIFDLDGVITSTSIFHYEAWKKIADELNIEFNEEKNEFFKGVSRKKCLELLLEWGNLKVSEEGFEELLVRKNEYYKEMLKSLTEKDVLEGIIDFIDKIHKEGNKVALFSVSKNTDEIITRLNIKDKFDVIVSGNDIKNSKPHYEGYLLAADSMNIDPRLCCMIEDSVSGILGARALSMKTIAIMKDNQANADICIDSTKLLTEI